MTVFSKKNAFFQYLTKLMSGKYASGSRPSCSYSTANSPLFLELEELLSFSPKTSKVKELPY